MNYILPIADIADPLSPCEIDQQPEASRIWASLKAAIGDLEYTEDQIKEHIRIAKDEQAFDIRLDTQESALSVVDNLGLSLDESDSVNILVVTNGIPMNAFETELQEKIMDKVQNLINSIEWE